MTDRLTQDRSWEHRRRDAKSQYLGMHHTIKHDVNYKYREGKWMGKRGAESSCIREARKNVREGLELVGFKNR